MVGEHPIGGKPKKQSGEMHPKIRKQWILFFAAIGILAVIGAALLNTPAQISNPSLAGPPQPGSNQPVTGSGAPSPTNTGQENKICVAYNNDPPYYSCKEYKTIPSASSNKLKSTWTASELDGSNIKNRARSEYDVFDDMKAIYDDGTLIVKGAFFLPETYDNEKVKKGVGMTGIMAKNIGKEPIKVTISINILNLDTRETQNPVIGTEKETVKLDPGKVSALQIATGGMKDFEISVQYT